MLHVEWREVLYLDNFYQLAGFKSELEFKCQRFDKFISEGTLYKLANWMQACCKVKFRRNYSKYQKCLEIFRLFLKFMSKQLQNLNAASISCKTAKFATPFTSRVVRFVLILLKNIAFVYYKFCKIILIIFFFGGGYIYSNRTYMNCRTSCKMFFLLLLFTNKNSALIFYSSLLLMGFLYSHLLISSSSVWPQQLPDR